MNPLFSRMMKRYNPPMNRKVMEGMAVSAMKHVEEYLDAQIRSVCEGMPPCLRYVTYEPCTSKEEFEEITKLRNGKRTFDLAKSTVHLVKYFFTFTDPMGIKHDIVRYIFLPYVLDAGIIQISGTLYHVIPVLSDKVFTPGKGSIFVRLAQDRNKMYRMYHTATLNGKRETRYVVWATIYRNPDDKQSTKTTKANTLLTHYLFAKYGFSGTFLRYAGSVPVFGGEEMTAKQYPPEEWVLCQSSGKQPATCLDKLWQPPKIRLAVKKEHWNPTMETLVMGFFYILDHFPDRFEPTLEYLDNRPLWMILIGLIVFGGYRGEGRLHKDISDNLETLDDYLDTAVMIKLAEKGIHLENYYDLLNYIQVHFNEMILEANNSGLNVYGKNLEVLSYVLYDILYGFVNAKFALKKVASRRPLSKKDVESTLQIHVKTGAIFKITSGKIVTKAVSCSGDHMYPNITSVIAEQENRAGAGRGNTDRVVVGDQHRLDLSMVTTGSLLNLPKSNPTPVARINPWVTLDERTGTVIPNPKFEALIEANRPLFKF